MNTSPLNLAAVGKTIEALPGVTLLSVHLVGQQSQDLGALGRVHLSPQEKIELK